MAISAGAQAPPFELESTTGAPISLASLAGKRLILFFYPRDNTPGCTRQAVELGAHYEALQAEGVEVLGVSKDSMASHHRFRDKHPIPFPLLSDPDNEVAKAFGAFGTKKLYGKEVQGTIRSTFLIGGDGVVQRVWSPVRVAGHADDVLAAVRG
jgi:peroxiredoxin Q/BCP